MSEEELQREIVSGAFSMQVADCEKNIRIQFEKLQQENNQLKEKINTYEDPEDLTLMFMYCDEKAKDKIKQLKDKLKGVQEERDYLFNKTSVENKYLQQDRDKYKKVIEEVMEYLDFIKFDKTDKYISISEYDEYKHLLQILDKAKDVK